MRTIITLALFLVVGFIGSLGFVPRATRRLPLAGLLATGMEFVLLGILVGPHGLDLINARVLADLEPIVYLSLGWIGLLFGIELSWTSLKNLERSVFRFLLVDAAGFVVAFSAAAYALLSWAWPSLGGVDRLVGALLLGITASVSSPTVVAIVAQRLPARGPVTGTVKIASALSALFPLVAMGLIAVVVHPHFMQVEGWGYGVVWWLFVNAVGLTLGFLMVLFTWGRTSDNELLLLILGTVFLIGGLCYYLELSSLYTAMIMGAVVGNFARKRDQLFRELHRIEKPLFLGFLVMTGAMLSPAGGMGRLAIVVAAYVVLRLAMKYALTGTAMAAVSPALGDAVGRRAGLALSGQGVMAIAIAVDSALAHKGAEAPVTLAVVTLAVLVNDAFGFVITRRVLAGSGEVVAPRRRGKKR